MRERRLVLDIVAVSECSFGARKRCSVRNKLCLADRCRIEGRIGRLGVLVEDPQGRFTMLHVSQVNLLEDYRCSALRCASCIAHLLAVANPLHRTTRGPAELQHDKSVFKIDVQQRATKQTVSVYLLEGCAKPE